jgi:regulator of sirC expression with transglutaminase-like and TPR domain
VKLDHKDISALVRLADDPDDRVSQRAFDELYVLGRKAIPYIENEIQLSENPKELKSLLQLSREIRFNCVYNDLKDWLSSDEKELNDAVKLIADCQFDVFDFDLYEKELQPLIHDTWKELSPRQTSFEVINTLNTLFFDFYKFQISQIDVLPQHSFPHVILQDRVATPFGISLLYAILAHKLNIPIYMVVLPDRCYLVHLNHYKNKLTLGNYFEGSDAQFFIDPLDNCKIKTIDEVEQEVKLYKAYNPNILDPSPHSFVVKCFLQELVLTYQTWSGHSYKSEKIEELLTLFD